jgi:hypothetical protein
MPGPLPDPNARRRNKRKPGTPLPLDGPIDPAPKCPYDLGKPGKKWWKWAWKLPQATAWDDGAIYFVARRAQLEDDLAALDFDDYAELVDLLNGADDEAVRRVEWALSTLKKAAGGKRAIEKEMREMDNKLGLNPKAFADLRWTLEVPDEEEPKAGKAGSGGSVTRLRAVDAA